MTVSPGPFLSLNQCQPNYGQRSRPGLNQSEFVVNSRNILFTFECLKKIGNVT